MRISEPRWMLIDDGDAWIVTTGRRLGIGILKDCDTPAAQRDILDEWVCALNVHGRPVRPTEQNIHLLAKFRNKTMRAAVVVIDHILNAPITNTERKGTDHGN